MQDISAFTSRFDVRRIANGVGLVVIITIVFLFVAGAVPQLVGADESYVVQSDSMSPAIDAGDVVFVSDTAPDQITEGDVITFEQAGADDSDRVTHRVVEVIDADGERRFRTRGDANEDPDPRLVTPSAVIGVVGFHVPYMGYVTAFAQSGLGILALVVVPAVLLVGLEVWDLMTATKPAADEESSNSGGEDQS